MFAYLFWFYGISPFEVFLMPNTVLYKKTIRFQTIQISTSSQLNCQKKFMSQAIQFSQTVLYFKNSV